jgi:DNA helicase IV
MPLEQTHPDLPSEQSYIDHAYACMDAMYEGVSALGSHGRNDFEREAFERWKAARMAALSDRTSALVFGRIDLAEPQTSDDATFYIGRHHVQDRERDTVVVDWRAPVARTFYRAGHADPMGLRSRRQFLLDGKEVLGLSDDDFAKDSDIRADEILQTDLRRRHAGRMRDIVATIQAEQDAIIRAPLEGIVVVQGGPGTGKTAIGLHRASFLLYEHRDFLSRHKVLVIGPNQTFMRYISQVLPSLGEVAVVQRTVDELAPIIERVHLEDPAAARVKGDERMPRVIACALSSRSGIQTQDLTIAVEGARIPLPATTVMDEVERIRAMGVPHKRGRGMLREALLMRVYRDYLRRLRQGSLALEFDRIAKQTREDPGFRRMLTTVWPAVGAASLVADLVTSPTRLREAADGILSPEEQRTMLRRGADVRARWTSADRALLDEAAALIDEPRDRYGHVIVDEAQDLSPMALRMIARRSRDGSMTVLGDLAQATGPWAGRGWDDVVAHLPQSRAATEELTLGYRVAPAIMEVASRVQAVAAPGLRSPRSVRAERGEVHLAQVDDVGAAVARLVPALQARTDFAAVIAPDAMLDAVAAALATAGIDAADARTHDLGAPLMLIPASIAKGLEFDGVLLVEPAAIVEQASLNLLYICMTRAMRSLLIVHAQPLPAVLEPTASGRSA